MQIIRIPDVDMETVAMDGILSRQGVGLEEKAIFEVRRCRRYDKRRRKMLGQPDGMGFGGWSVRISWET
ncbi:hypothetical protein QN219_30430 [Sinorhizobium sp. 7-81]|nr:hypothetical protein [Sinorhizobium sp. 8-89]MDK1494280.1 hypothetical protein [Sinorhizobium sp. 8-89]